MIPPTLTTARLTLRPLRVDDAAALHPLYSDAEQMTYWTHGALSDVAATRAQLVKTLHRPDWRTWAITRTGDDTAIGTVACLEKRQGKVTEIGYSLDRARRPRLCAGGRRRPDRPAVRGGPAARVCRYRSRQCRLEPAAVGPGFPARRPATR